MRAGYSPPRNQDRSLRAHLSGLAHFDGFEARLAPRTSTSGGTRTDSVDRHDPPTWLHELVILRDATCVFAGCRIGARRCDLDHIVPFDDTGPPGQTSPQNLACLCRRHHNAKTHRGWRYRRTDTGYEWTSPLGRTYSVPR